MCVPESDDNAWILSTSNSAPFRIMLAATFLAAVDFSGDWAVRALDSPLRDDLALQLLAAKVHV